MQVQANGAAGRAWLDALAGLAADLDPERVRAWVLVRSVDDALWALDSGWDDPEWDVACARVLRA
jgi:hypothetical protein